MGGKLLQWNPSITATIGEWRFGPYREVAFREGSCFFLLFSCSSHISLHPVITLSKRRRLHSLMEQDCNRTETTMVLLNTLYSYHTESHKKLISMMHVAIDLHWIIIKDWIGHADHHGPE